MKVLQPSTVDTYIPARFEQNLPQRNGQFRNIIFNFESMDFKSIFLPRKTVAVKPAEGRPRAGFQA